MAKGMIYPGLFQPQATRWLVSPEEPGAAETRGFTVSVDTSNMREISEPLGLLMGEGGNIDFSEGAGERLAALRTKLKAVIAESHDVHRTEAQREKARVHSFTLRQKMLRLERAEAVALLAAVMDARRRMWEELEEGFPASLQNKGVSKPAQGCFNGLVCSGCGERIYLSDFWKASPWVAIPHEGCAKSGRMLRLTVVTRAAS